MKKLKSLFFPTILALAFGLMLSCAKSSEDNINDTVADTNDAIDEGVANTNENLEDTLEDNNDTAVDLENALHGGGGSSNSSSCNNSKASIVGNAVTEKSCHPNCPKNKAVLWNLDKCMTVVGESYGVVDATGHNGSIYIADDGGFYWIVGAGNSIEKHQLNYSSGYKLSEVTGIDVNSNGDVYVAGMVQKNKKEYTAYWKNGELVKWFRYEKNDWYSEKNVAADSNGNVYIPGWWMKSHSSTLSTYWKNGILKKLTNSYDGEATDVDISGGKVYFSGNYGKLCNLFWHVDPCTGQNGTLAAYWKGGRLTKVTKVKTAGYKISWLSRSRASSIHVEGSTVYMAGEVEGTFPVYWKNKIQHNLPVEYNFDDCDYCRADPIDISVLDGKVLVVGYYNHVGGGYRGAVYWLDNKLHKLCEDCDSSDAVAVVVMD